MNQFDHDKIINYGMFSPKIENSRHFKLNKNNFGNYSTYSKYTNSVLGSPINLYSRTRNITKNRCLSPDHSKVSAMISPIHRNSSKLQKSSSQRNIITRPQSSTSRGLPSVKNNSLILSPAYRRNKKRNINKKIIYKNLKENFINKQKFFNLETEKLYQETHQIKKLVKILTKELSVLKKENAEKDRLISLKEKQINDIIMNNNMTTFENTKNNTNNNEYNTSLISNNSNNNLNNYDTSTIFNDSIYANALISNKNSSTGTLFFKIKKEIKKTNNEIKLEEDKYKKLKRSIFNTKVNELKIESNLLEDHMNKINSLLMNALQVKEKNEKKGCEIETIKENIEKQEKIIDNLIIITNRLETEKNELQLKLAKDENELNTKIKQVNKNNSKLDKLKKKNENLSKDKTINNEKYITRINGNPLTFNSLYINKIVKLKKSVKFYKKNLEYTENELNKLKDKRKKLIDSEKIKSIKFDSYFLDKKNNINGNMNIKNKDNSITMKSNLKLPEEEIISKLKSKLKESKENEKKMEEKINLYQYKLKEIDINQEEEKEEINESQIEFGIDSDNPYYIEDEKNIPELNNKFTSSQFNQFTYILFKNFESKGIVQNESKNKLINPLIEFSNKNNISVVEYPSNNFDMIIEEYTNIILNVLNVNNSNNHILTKIFISALFYNSGCNVNKFIEYFNILFSYTKNYILEEEKYKDKLKNKYIEQTKKLISCINTYINTEFNSSPYFPLLKMKELLDKNEINLKDKYIEYLFYYMKKFEDPESKLSDLKFSLLNNILSSNQNEIKNFEINNNSNLNFNENDINVDYNIIKEEDKVNLSKKEELNAEEIDKKSSNKNNGISGIKSPTEEDFTNMQKKKNHTDKNEKENSEDYEDDEDSMTEITNGEYIKQLTEAICIMQKGLSEANIIFSDLMSNVIQKRKISGIFYECITIEDFNDQLKSINIVLSDLKLSCLCSKYSIPNELRLIDKNKIEKDINDQSNGNLKLEEEEEDN